MRRQVQHQHAVSVGGESMADIPTQARTAGGRARAAHDVAEHMYEALRFEQGFEPRAHGLMRDIVDDEQVHHGMRWAQ
jgi:hypothetical protein